MLYFYSDDSVKIQNVAQKWNGKSGTVSKWLHDNLYLVKVNNKELVLDSSKNELIKN